MKTLSVGRVADRLGVSVDVVRSLEERGELKATRTAGGHRRFRPEDVERYGARRRAPQQSPLARPTKQSRRRANPPPPQPRAIEPEFEGFEIEDEFSDFDERPDRVPEQQVLGARTQAAAAASVRAADEERRRHEEREAAEEQRRRYEDLKKYGQHLGTWAFLSGEWRARVVAELERFVAPSQIPAWVPDTEAKELVKARVDAIIKQCRDAEAEKRAQDETKRRIESLIQHGRHHALLETLNWDEDGERDRARREVERTLRREVQADWNEADMEDRVNDVLSQWEDEDDEDDDEDGDYEEEGEAYDEEEDGT